MEGNREEDAGAGGGGEEAGGEETYKCNDAAAMPWGCIVLCIQFLASTYIKQNSRSREETHEFTHYKFQLHG